ncbi:DUF5916 domain-containing protein [Tenacibaculum sp. UWU-22]|uniref:DUF5916 domain-containing protein n=1 Tax=Tenacibaculum sp. UWU-22 TaxID=3234187 RepID=UPI0034DABB25
MCLLKTSNLYIPPQNKNLTTTLLFLLFVSIHSFGQINVNRKKIDAIRIQKAPKIDGVLDDVAWKNIPEAKNFVMLRPDNGKPEPKDHKTTVKFVYDDNAIYISAIMYDPNPTKIPAEFTTRDNIGNTDFFIVTINPNDDGQNPFEFIVTASGVQADAKVSNSDEDYNWSAVWESAIKITDKGWVAELKIPYSALRFANLPIQSWGVNFGRRIENLNAQFTWNYIDNKQGIWTQYDGLVENLKNITPPTRLAFYPYASGTLTFNDGKTLADWSVGMDLKYGITENFTLDATLIPDFGQTAFDNVTLNLGPFEQQFSEQRQFFTEGTELFSKGRLFYSRRIGGSPIDQFDVKSQLTNNEIIINNPEKVDMINAIKVSGRLKNGLGIGVFNAITKETHATVLDTLTNTTRELTTNPFSNYNIMVVDQQFNQNSAITLINTNVIRDGRFRDANVTGLLWHVENKSSSYNIDGSFKTSSISDDSNNPNTGYAFDTSIGKHSGKWVGEIGYNFENKDYNPNDLGILFSNNEQTIYGHVGYRILKPKGIFNNYSISLYYNANFLHNPSTYTGFESGLSAWAQTKKRFAFGLNLNYDTVNKDFFEPRQGTRSGIFFERPEKINVNHWGSTDYRKKLAVDYEWEVSFYKKNPKFYYGFEISPRYRFTNQFSLSYSFEYYKTENDYGWVSQDSQPNDIIFGQRDWSSYKNSLSGKYNFNTKAALSITFRHNWSKVPYNNQYYKLNTTNGKLIADTYTGNHDVNFNSWNLGFNYVWQFAPGSQLIALYRNSISSFNNRANLSFSENLTDLFKNPKKDVFSLRLVYFIDYNQMKHVFNK